jgi:hypothetical protein
MNQVLKSTRICGCNRKWGSVEDLIPGVDRSQARSLRLRESWSRSPTFDLTPDLLYNEATKGAKLK